MRDKHYKLISFRLSEETIEELKKRRDEKDISWNLLFKELLDGHEETKKDTS